MQNGDYSYGMYLYAFPISHTLVATIPALQVPFWLYASAVPTTFLFAAFSWHFFEEPTLKLKRFVGRKPVPIAGKTMDLAF